MHEPDREQRPRYIVGIDLGTTNTVVAFADTHAHGRPLIETFAVAQLVAPGEVAARAQLPSFRYHVRKDELTDADLALGFDAPDRSASDAPLPELPRGVT